MVAKLTAWLVLTITWLTPKLPRGPGPASVTAAFHVIRGDSTPTVWYIVGPDDTLIDWVGAAQASEPLMHSGQVRLDANTRHAVDRYVDDIHIIGPCVVGIDRV